MKARKLSFLEKMELKAMMPEIPKTKSKYFKIIRKTEYDLMKKALSREEKYLQQILDQFNEIKEKDEKIKSLEQKRRKLASKIGGLTKALNKERNEFQKKHTSRNKKSKI